MKADYQTVFRYLAEAVCKVKSDVELSTLTGNTDMVYDLNVDSLDLHEFFIILEDEYDIDVPEEDLAGVMTLGELTKRIVDGWAARGNNKSASETEK